MIWAERSPVILPITHSGQPPPIRICRSPQILTGCKGTGVDFFSENLALQATTLYHEVGRNEAIPFDAVKATIPFSLETFPQWVDHMTQLVPVTPLRGQDQAKSHRQNAKETTEIIYVLDDIGHLYSGTAMARSGRPGGRYSVYDLERMSVKPAQPSHEGRPNNSGAEGYRWIMISGEVSFEDGQSAGALLGKLIQCNSV